MPMRKVPPGFGWPEVGEPPGAACELPGAGEPGEIGAQATRRPVAVPATRYASARRRVSMVMPLPRRGARRQRGQPPLDWKGRTASYFDVLRRTAPSQDRPIVRS